MFSMGNEVRALAGLGVCPGDHQFALLQLLSHQVLGYQRDTAAGLGCADAHGKGVESRAMVAVFAVQALALEPFVPGFRARCALQQAVRGEGAGAVEAVAGQQLR
ncbi:hypothetical protein D3C80_2001910 [compost metagenome]